MQGPSLWFWAARLLRLSALVTLALGVAACGGTVAAATPTATPRVLLTLPLPTPVPPTPTPTPTPIPADRILFQDDFSDPNSGWTRFKADWGITDYINGRYRIGVGINYTDLWANPGLDFADVRIEVDAQAIAGSEYNSFGVICRYQDDANFYFFILSNAGYYAIVKMEDGEQYQLTPERQLAVRGIIRPGSQVNRVQAECVGDTLRLYANGHLLAEVQDDTFTHGDVGLIAGAFTDAGVVVEFDNFVVLKPEQGAP